MHGELTILKTIDTLDSKGILAEEKRRHTMDFTGRVAIVTGANLVVDGGKLM